MWIMVVGVATTASGYWNSDKIAIRSTDQRLVYTSHLMIAKPFRVAGQLTGMFAAHPP